MKLGTSSLVVAAFVGPGTVLTCASAGVNFGYGLAWVLLFATVSAFVLQSFTAGTGILARQGQGEALRSAFTSPIGRGGVFTLVVLGLWIGCAAFEMGNLLGAASGIAVLVGDGLDTRWIVLLLAVVAGVLLLLQLRWLIRMFTLLVIGMSLLFLAAFWVSPVDLGAAFRGLLIPDIPDGSLLTLIALIGTTIVTYNLFLHAATAKRYWANTTDARSAWRNELKGMAIFIPLGGLISLVILATGAALYGSTDSFEGEGIAAFARLLEPVAGSSARYFFGLGLFAAGITSAMTAPMAAAAGIQELFGWPQESADWRYRLVWLSVLCTGLVFGLMGWNPLNAIIAAQAANGILLPLIAGFVLYLTLKQTALKLPRWYFGLGILITLICAGLGGAYPVVGVDATGRVAGLHRDFTLSSLAFGSYSLLIWRTRQTISDSALLHHHLPIKSYLS